MLLGSILVYCPKGHQDKEQTSTAHTFLFVLSDFFNLKVFYCNALECMVEKAVKMSQMIRNSNKVSEHDKNEA